jgi:hypothetical protein
LLTIGHGEATLSVVLGEPLGGYIDRTEGVLGSIEPLEVHAISIGGASSRMVLLVVDLICVNVDLVARIRAAAGDLGVSRVWVSATHAHSTPEAGCYPGGAATPEALAERVVASSLVAIRSAIAAEEPGRVRAVRSIVSGVGGRRNVPPSETPQVPVDVLLFESDAPADEASRRRGMLVVSPVHPTVLPPDNRFTSADLTGGIRRALASEAEWVVAATGAAGDISTRITRQARDTAEIDRIASRVADAVRATLRAGADDEHPEGDASLVDPLTVTLDLPTRPPLPDSAGSAVDAPQDPFSARRQAVLEQGIALAEESRTRLSTTQHSVTIEVGVIDGVRLVAVPAELYLGLAEQIRAGYPAHPTVVLGYTNGYLGYVPDREAPLSYETVVSPVAAGSGEAIVEAALGLLAEADADANTTVATGTLS